MNALYARIPGYEKTGQRSIDRQPQNFREIGISAHYSFLLMLLSAWEDRRFSDKDLLDILDAVFVFFLRRRMIREINRENQVVLELARLVPDLESAPNKKGRMFALPGENDDKKFRLPNDVECGELFWRRIFISAPRRVLRWHL